MIELIIVWFIGSIIWGYSRKDTSYNSISRKFILVIFILDLIAIIPLLVLYCICVFLRNLRN